MSLMFLAFGKDDPSPRRLLVGSIAYVLLGFALHGGATQFVTGSFLPAPFLLDPPTWVAFCALGLVVSVLVFLCVPPAPHVARHSARHALLLLLAVPLFAFLAWLALAGSVAALWTRFAAPAHSEVVTLRPEHRYSRRGCDHRAYGVHVDGRSRGSLCIPASLYDAYPDRKVRTRIVGRRSALGFAIDAFEVDDDRDAR